MDLSNENVIHIKTGKTDFLQFRKLLEYKDKIAHAYSLGIKENYRTSDGNENAIENYRNLCEGIDCDYRNLIKTNQQHTDRVKIVEQKINVDKPDFNLEQYKNTDGLITNKRNKILATTNADCILLLFWDPEKQVIANVHSGWRGTLQTISIKTVEKMINQFNCNPKDIICCICPSIRKCHFEVEKDVKDLFYNKFKDLKEINQIIEEKEKNKKWVIDTVLINKVLLSEIGLKEENIIDSGICSVCNKDLIHSYRAEKEGYGLETALITLK